MPITTVHFGFAKAKDQVVITNGVCYPGLASVANLLGYFLQVMEILN